jgi:membrane fusion protein (multidrug efflux system)
MGQPVELSVPAYPGEKIPGRVALIAPLGDARAHTFDVTIYPSQQDGRLLAGMYAQVDVKASERPEATLVPREAVVQQEGANVVFVVEDGKASARRVQVGVSDDQHVEILSGVSSGEEVITVGHFGLRDGQAVRAPGSQE